MGCTHSKDHPKNADLVKLKKKYDTEPIKKAKLINVWVIGGNKEKSLELAKLITERMTDYLLITEESLLQTAMDESQPTSDRAAIIKEILQDQGTVCPGIVLDLVVEAIVSKLKDIRGVVYHGIPRDREQAWHLQRLVGPVNLVVYCELKGEALKVALTQEGEDFTVVKNRVDHFQRSIIHLAKHKTTMKVNGESDTNTLIEECIDKINSLSDNLKSN